jgi:3-methylcrotonyl-CoA carboxylase alpha subunit
MIAKLIAHAPQRADAIAALAAACGAVCCEPVKTNAWFLKRLLETAEFGAGAMTTNTIAALSDHILQPPQPSEALLQAAADRAIFHDAFVRGSAGDPEFDRLAGLVGFRLNAAPDLTVRLDVNGEERRVDYDWAASGDYWQGAQGSTSLGMETVMFEGGAAFVTAPATMYASGKGSAADGAIIAPMPGRIVSVEVEEGASVTAGQKLVVLEAMKMEQALVAPFDGVVEALTAVAGGQVQDGAVLARVAPFP